MTASHRATARLRGGGLSSCSVGDELVVLDLDGSQYLTIRGSGIFLFELLGVERDRDELVAALLARFRSRRGHRARRCRRVSRQPRGGRPARLSAT